MAFILLENVIVNMAIKAMTTESNQCPICEGDLTLKSNIVQDSCNNPSHWQAAGLISAKDYYTMAQVAARAALAREREAADQQTPVKP